MKSFNCNIGYPDALWNPEENANYYVYLKTLDVLKGLNQKSFVFMPAYNEELIKKCHDDAFDQNVLRFEDEAERRGITVESFVSVIDQSFFLDDMHLDSKGNERMAEYITGNL